MMSARVQQPPKREVMIPGMRNPQSRLLARVKRGLITPSAPMSPPQVERPQKRRRVATGSESELPGPSSLVYFDPASLVSTKEGTFKVPSDIKKYLDKHMKRCLSKEEREALYKEHPRPHLASLVPPKVDMFMSNFLGKRLPRELDADLSRIQGAVLATARPWPQHGSI